MIMAVGAKDLDASLSVKRLLVGAPPARAQRSCEIQRIGVRVQLHNTDFRPILVRVLVKGDNPRLVRFDEIDKQWNAASLRIELAGPQSVASNEDEWTCNHDPLASGGLLVTLLARQPRPLSLSTRNEVGAMRCVKPRKMRGFGSETPGILERWQCCDQPRSRQRRLPGSL